MRDKYRDKADFLAVYIKEAHPTDEWQMTSNETDGVCYPQPRTLAERVRIASDFAARHKFSIPLWVDEVDNRADALYAGWPERFYIITAEGVIAYKGDPGPFGFKPDEVEDWLARIATR